MLAGFVRINHHIVVRMFADGWFVDRVLQRVPTRTDLQLHDGRDAGLGGGGGDGVALDGQQSVDDRRPPPPAVLRGRTHPPCSVVGLTRRAPWSDSSAVLRGRTPRSEAAAAAGATRRPDEAVRSLGEVRAARRPGVGRLQEAGTCAIAEPLTRVRLAAALARKDLAELVSDEEVDDEVDRRVDGQQDIGETVGAVYERVH